jgi:hypothetical protein
MDFPQIERFVRYFRRIQIITKVKREAEGQGPVLREFDDALTFP